MKINQLVPVYVNRVPDSLENGKIYIYDFPHYLAVHLCACGCKQEVVTPLGSSDGWELTKNKDSVTIRPSIGNFNGEKPHHAHYYITNNQIEWL